MSPDVFALAALAATTVCAFAISFSTQRRVEVGERAAYQAQYIEDSLRGVFTLQMRDRGVSPHRGHAVHPVHAGGLLVAHLCATCDKQLPEGWKP